MKTSFNHYGHYEINISVKCDGKGSKRDTQHFLNTLLCFMGEARRYYHSMGFNALEKEVDDISKGIRTTLENQGYYDNL